MAQEIRQNTTNYQHPHEPNLLNVHKAMDYNTDGKPELRVTNSLSLTSAPWYLQVARGLVTGARSVFKAGYNQAVANNSEESLWAHSNLYPWASWDDGGTLSCVSTSASDTGTMTIVGLRSSDWTEVTETVTLTGLTPVVTTTSFIRINFLHYNGVNGAANVGEIDVSISGTVVGDIHPEHGIAQMAQFTVPAGYTAYVLSGNSNIGKGNDGVGRFKYRPYGSSFQTAMMFLLYQSTFDFEFAAPLAIPEKTDIDVTIVASNAGTAVTCAYSMILIDNSI